METFFDKYRRPRYTYDPESIQQIQDFARVFEEILYPYRPQGVVTYLKESEAFGDVIDLVIVMPGFAYKQFTLPIDRRNMVEHPEALSQRLRDVLIEKFRWTRLVEPESNIQLGEN